MAGSIYISYGPDDREYVDRLAEHLAAEGIPAWYDRDRPDDDATIPPQLEDCAAVLLIQSAASAASARVRNEIDYARAHGKRVFTLMLDAPTRMTGARIIYGVPSRDHLPPASFLDELRALLPPPVLDAAHEAEPAEYAVPEAERGGIWIDSELEFAARSAEPYPDEPTGPPPAPRPRPGAAASPAAAPGYAFPPASQPDVVAPAAPAPSAGSRLEFAAAYRRLIERSRRYPVLFFVHRPDARDLVRELIDRRAAQLGGSPAVSVAGSSQQIRSGTTLTIVPNVLGATFEPDRIDVVAGDPVRELTFQMAVPNVTPAGTIDGYIDIFVGPLVVGQVPVEFEVEAAPTVPRQASADQLLEVSSASIFDKIFISYSHKDSAVVDLCVDSYEGLGVRVLIDKQELRSGQDWRAKLESMIRESDIFQLYWSTAAASSSEVDHEWRLALGLGRNRFVRPLYWETPLPPLPEPLSKYHFSKIDVKSLRRAMKGDGLFRRAMKAFGVR
jgi:hypothetical protein